MRANGLLSGAVLILAVAVGVRAGDPFQLTAHTTSGPSESTVVTGTNLPDLVNNLLKTQSQFSLLQNRDITASVRYGGENNALVLTKNAANTSATLTIPSIGFRQTFTGADESDLEKQVEDFAKEHGAHIYGDFIRSINETTPLGVTDGNPLAETSLLADQAFTQFGLLPMPVYPGQGMPNPLDQVATSDLRFDITSGYSHTDSGSGYYIGGAISLGFKFGERAALVFTTPFTYLNLQGSDVYDIGEEISIPVLLIQPEGDKTFSWLLTPTVFGGAAGSYDLASGGTLLGGGITSSLTYQFDTFFFTLANQYVYFHGFPVSFGNYKLETNLEQEILKNGIKVSKFFGDSLYVDAGVSYTDMLLKADVKNYWSPTVGVGYRFGSYGGIRIGYNGDFGHGYTVSGAQVQIYLNY